MRRSKPTRILSEKTRRAYKGDLWHYEVEFGGMLPASATQIENYLVAYGSSLSPATLERRLAAIAKFHRDQGFEDPTKAMAVTELLKGIWMANTRPPRQARALSRDIVFRLVQHVSLIASQTAAHATLSREEAAERLIALRDRLLFIVGYMCAWRAEELTRLCVDQCQVRSVDDRLFLEIYLPPKAGESGASGRWWLLPGMPETILCPVLAWQEWIAASGLVSGEVFRRIDRWSNVKSALNAGSIGSLMRRAMTSAGLDDTGSYSTHSFRRGFATDWNDKGGNLQDLMAWVGWKSPESAFRYSSHHPHPITDSIERLLCDWRLDRPEDGYPPS